MMNRADVIRLAKEAGLEQLVDGMDCSDWKVEIERFASLVAAAEREQCAKLADDEYGDLTVLGDGIYNQLGDAEKTAQNIAKAIRALGGE